MKLWKSLLITSIALTSLNVVATESGQNFNQSAKHSALAGSTGLKGSGQVAVAAVTMPIMVVGSTAAVAGSTGVSVAEDLSGPVALPIAAPMASVAVVGSGATVSAAVAADSVGAPVPLEIGEFILIR
ncbi:hypothetical protein [Agarivorans litoreus]|uniref:hypothetical protein n=1 Tax=Agarivorans litoreus TaxID=1510455 RepID=UPI001C7E07EE|nr:hypothetical protein [Agarivorans litoreus]